MSLIADLRSLEPSQRSAIWASYLGWTLDAFDFFLLAFMLSAIGKEFGTDIKAVAVAIMLTLAARPFGALFFGILADRFGRRPILIVVILAFSAFSALSGVARSLPELLVIRTLFGFAMGGEWGIGASLVMETIPAKLRGPVSGLLQSGYPSGYFIASLVYFALFDRIGWRGMFFVGIAPALLVFLIRMHVEESPAYLVRKAKVRANPFAELARNWKIALYMIVLMTAFNAFSHGTQDLYPTFLQKQHHFDTKLTGTLTAIMNVGAIVGGIAFGIWSEKIGRKRAIIIACALALPVFRCGRSARLPAPRRRRFPDAGRRSRRVGDRAGAPQRAFAWSRARDVPRLCLSAGQFADVAQCRLPGRNRGEPRGRLRLRAGPVRRRDGGDHRRLDRVRPGTEARRLPGRGEGGSRVKG